MLNLISSFLSFDKMHARFAMCSNKLNESQEINSSVSNWRIICELLRGLEICQKIDIISEIFQSRWTKEQRDWEKILQPADSSWESQNVHKDLRNDSLSLFVLRSNNHLKVLLSIIMKIFHNRSSVSEYRKIWHFHIHKVRT